MSNDLNLYSFSPKAADGSTYPLDQYRDQVVLVVNVASRCGFTPQYAGLEELYREYRTRGFSVLGFPCNQFGAQEPGTDSEIAQFCQREVGITFPVLAKIEVNGPGAAPLYAWLKKSAPGFLGSEFIKWNFTKFLIGRDGRVRERFAPNVKPSSIRAKVAAELA